MSSGTRWLRALSKPMMHTPVSARGQRNDARAPLTLAVQYAVRERAALKARLPRTTLIRWIQGALSRPAALTLRFVDQEEGLRLNRAYRGGNQATNVLTFVYTEPSDQQVVSDIVLCCPVIEREAVEQHKTLDAHYAHLIIHGALHAQG